MCVCLTALKAYPCSVFHEELSERLGRIGEIWGEFADLISHAEKAAEVAQTCWCCKADNGFDFVWVRSDSLAVDNVAQEFDGGLSKHAFLHIERHSQITQALENVSQPLVMLLTCLPIDEYIVHHTHQAYETTESFRHMPLKVLWRR